MNAADLTAQRLACQQIAVSAAQTPLEIVRHLGAMQAQDYHSALWAIGLRTGKTEADVVRAIEERAIIRSWPQRGTLHFICAADAHWQMRLSSERILRSALRRRELLNLDEETLRKCAEILMPLLAGGKRMARPQIMETLEQAGISTQAGRSYHILFHLSLRGITYVGPMQGKQQTFGLLNDLVPDDSKVSRKEGIAHLTQRYFASHGPATRDDFMWWSSLTASDAKRGLDANEQTLRSETVGGKTYWLSRDAPEPILAEAAFLLPCFDEYLLGYKDRSAALPAEYAPRIVPGNNGMFLSTVVVRGQVIGTWKRSLKKASVEITITPFEKLSQADKRLLDAPAAQYGRFVGLPATLEIE